VNWINSVLGRGGPQVKKVAYLLTVSVGLACLVADLCIERTISTTWVAALGVITGFVTTGYVWAKKIEQDGP